MTSAHRAVERAAASASSLVQQRVEDLVDAAFHTVSRNPSDAESAYAWRLAVTAALMEN